MRITYRIPLKNSCKGMFFFGGYDYLLTLSDLTSVSWQTFHLKISCFVRSHAGLALFRLGGGESLASSGLKASLTCALMARVREALSTGCPLRR